MSSFVHANITNCTFQHCTNVTLTSQLIASVNINAANFRHNSGSVRIEAALVNVVKSYFDRNKANASIIFGIFSTNNVVKSAVIIGCNFSSNTGYSIKCLGSSYLWLN